MDRDHPRRTVLLPGETISASYNLPIGQVFFDAKAAAKVKTAYGLEHSPHYLRKSRQQNAAPEVRATGDTDSKAP